MGCVQGVAGDHWPLNPAGDEFGITLPPLSVAMKAIALSNSVICLRQMVRMASLTLTSRRAFPKSVS